jgi:hypothetical protein
MKLVVKPHPWDKLTKYSSLDVNIFPFNNIPAEALFHIINPEFIMTPYSSAGVTASRLFAFPVIFLYPLLDIKLSSKIRAILENGCMMCSFISFWNDFFFIKKVLKKRANAGSNNREYNQFMKLLFQRN